MWILALLTWRIHWYSSRDCLYQSLYLCLCLHCLLITRGTPWLFGVVVLIRLLGKGEIMWVNFEVPKVLHVLWDLGQAWLVGVWYFWYVIVQGIFLVFFGTARLIISWVNPLGYDDEEIKVLVWSLTVLFQKVSGSGCSANKSMLMVYAHAHASQLNLYLLPQVQLPIKIFWLPPFLFL